MLREELYRVARQDKETFRVSEFVFYLARYWMFLALGAFALYFILVAIESHKTSIVITRSYRVPIEREETNGDNGSDD